MTLLSPHTHTHVYRNLAALQRMCCVSVRGQGEERGERTTGHASVLKFIHLAPKCAAASKIDAQSEFETKSMKEEVIG